MADLITLESSALPENSRVATFRGVEGMSRPYEFEVMVVVEEADGEEIDLADGIGGKARLVIDRADDKLPPYIFAGILGSLEHLHSFGGRSLVRAVIVPRLWTLGLSRHSRNFTKKSVPEILQAILEDNGFTSEDFEIRLSGYAKEEHVCQYHESDLAFISRWMEREGIYYYFEHAENGEKLIICDAEGYPDEPLGAPVRYFPQTGMDRSAGPSFRTFRARHASLPAVVKLKDYDYAKPNLDVSGQANVSQHGTAEVTVHGARFFSPSDGKRLAQIRAEEMLAREVVFRATGTRSHLRSGHTFELDEHPKASFNKKYLAIEVHHHGNQAAGHTQWKELMEIEHDEVYFVEVDAIPADTQFRPECRTPWPRIFGVENAIIDGPADSEYAQIDDQGRYLVKFKYDESNLKQGNASTYVRMMQPHGGGIEGFHFPLRKGTEVVLTFLGGDPDRPVISGVVPNALTPSPVTSGNHTKNVIQTGGRNRLELEDLAGQQRVTLSTPYSNSYLRMGSPNDGHEIILRTDDNTLLDFGKNFDLDVGLMGGGNWTVDVATDWKSHIQGGMALGVGVGYGPAGAGCIGITANQSISMTANHGSYSLTVTEGPWTTRVPANTMTTTTKGDYTVTVTTNNTKFDTNGKTEILSKGLVKVESSNATMDLLSKGLMHIHGDAGVNVDTPQGMEIKATKDILIEANKVDVKSKSEWKWEVLGAEVSVKGSQSETYLGIKNENILGLQVESLVGGKIEGVLAAEIRFGATLSLVDKVAEFELKKGKIVKKEAELGSVSITLIQQSVTITQVGIFMLA
ncbi:type VI secretion system Vgr family protein [Polyangium mundeleinium]|uniref:Type VI secretion system tip protein TssI/VgrG n=1 Tax=Polyangium mundeleinium TaxID=2995306 RepID=A0ABT5EDQ8_9BACT|nr:type VI secretion system tip protein TssI/VgrG [Polyangium mundeleinium]MDC0739952.1 type VI secretion system tip protein TssI/VgrG [Polyangium mundeleinium]